MYLQKGTLDTLGVIWKYGCESWTMKNAECLKIDAFELWH